MCSPCSQGVVYVLLPLSHNRFLTFSLTQRLWPLEAADPLARRALAELFYACFPPRSPRNTMSIAIQLAVKSIRGLWDCDGVSLARFTWCRMPVLQLAMSCFRETLTAAELSELADALLTANLREGDRCIGTMLILKCLPSAASVRSHMQAIDSRSKIPYHGTSVFFIQ